MHQTEKPEDMFNGYYNLRYFLSHKDNAYQLDIGKLHELGLRASLYDFFQIAPSSLFLSLFS